MSGFTGLNPGLRVIKALRKIYCSGKPTWQTFLQQNCCIVTAKMLHSNCKFCTSFAIFLSPSLCIIRDNNVIYYPTTMQNGQELFSSHKALKGLARGPTDAMMKSCVFETRSSGSSRNKELISVQTSCVSRVSGPLFLLISNDITLEGGRGRRERER